MAETEPEDMTETEPDDMAETKPEDTEEDPEKVLWPEDEDN